MSSKLNVFLEASKQALDKLDDCSWVHVVIGNESCDLDSIVSAIAYGYFLQLKAAEDGSTALPLLQCTEESFRLRGDAMLLFEQLGLGIESLSFLDSTNLQPAITADKLRVTLVDHNALSMKLSHLAPFVQGVVDHHRDEQITYPAECSRIIEPVGSSATLVAEQLLAVGNDAMDEVLAEFLLAPILLDTYNLNPSAKRSTDKDIYVAERLQSMVSMSSDELYRSVLAALCDNSSFSTEQLLSKDYKEGKARGKALGFSSILGSLEELVNGKEFVSGVEQFAEAKKLDLLVLLGIDVEEAELRGRSIALFQSSMSSSEELLPALGSFLMTSKEIQASPLQSLSSRFILMKQNNVKASRKLIMPAVLEFVSGDLVAVDPNTSVFVNVKPPPPVAGSEPINLDSYVHVEATPSTDTQSTDDVVEKPADNGSHDAVGDEAAASTEQHPLEPVVKIIPGPAGKSNDAATLDANTLSVSYETQQQLRERVMEPPNDDPSAVEQREPIREYSIEEEQKETRHFRMVTVGDNTVRVDLQQIEPYRKTIQHMGYKGTTAIVLISACYLPPRSIPNYATVLSQLFYYVISTLERLVVDDYVIVYFHSGAPRRSLPGFGWLRRFYDMVDRRLRKNLIQLLIVHPSIFIKTMLVLARPFISSKFYRKVHQLPLLGDVDKFLKLDEDLIPQPVIDHNKVLLERHQRYVVPEATSDKKTTSQSEDEPEVAVEASENDSS